MFAGRHAAPSSRTHDTDKSISLQVQVPIWSSGGTHSRVKQAVVPLAGRQAARRARFARNRAHRARRLSRRHVGNLARRRRSSRRWNRAARRCKATEAGYDVGTRTAIDVLAARQHAGPGLYELLAQPLRLHAQRAAAQAGRRPPRPQGARRRECVARSAAAAGALRRRSPPPTPTAA